MLVSMLIWSQGCTRIMSNAFFFCCDTIVSCSFSSLLFPKPKANLWPKSPQPNLLNSILGCQMSWELICLCQNCSHRRRLHYNRLYLVHSKISIVPPLSSELKLAVLLNRLPFNLGRLVSFKFVVCEWVRVSWSIDLHCNLNCLPLKASVWKSNFPCHVSWTKGLNLGT